MHRHWFEYIVPRSTWLASLAAIVVWLVPLCQAMTRWSLYLLIPPLTWVGAALIKNVVDVLVA